MRFLLGNYAITVEGLGKQYNIGALKEKIQHDTIRDKITSVFQTSLNQITNRKKTIFGSKHFWAVRDVSFKVKQGEILGIIGNNGAGKSTLLKLLCRVTSPTEGRIVLNGRVGTLLEVGTGFHQELTGRENIYLSGAILGMDKAYINRKIDDIIQFSGITKFIDTPVKRYSSGMSVRLGFAVAAHLEPEILLIDEVLAVGDSAFQKQCLGKISSITREGRTILLVSHNMASINSLCSRVLLLDSGNIVLDGHPSLVVREYLKRANTNKETGLVYTVNNSIIDETKCGEIEIEGVELLDSNFKPLAEYGTLEDLIVRIKYNANVSFLSASFVVDIKDLLNVRVLHLNNSPISNFIIDKIEGRGHVDLLIEKLPLLAGRYLFDICLTHEGASQDKGPVHLPEVITLDIAERDIYGGNVAMTNHNGCLCVSHKWSHTLC